MYRVSQNIYLCLMKHEIETMCLISEIQLFPERKFCRLNFAPHEAVNGVLSQS